MDVMMAVARKDAHQLGYALSSLLASSRTPIRKVFIVWQGSGNRATGPPALELETHRAPRSRIELFHEQNYPFSIHDVRRALRERGSRENHAGWYFQQLLKLYSFRVLPGCLPRLLIIDCDVALNAPLRFFDSQGRALLAYGYPFRWRQDVQHLSEYGTVDEVRHSHVDHAKRLVPGWRLANVWSGMQHHQAVSGDVMEDLLSRAEAAHGKSFWRAFIEQVDCDRWNGASEYVLYFHFALTHYRPRVVPRHVDGFDVIHDSRQPLRFSTRQIGRGRSAALVGCHGFVELARRLRTMDYIPSELRCKLRQHDAFQLELTRGVFRLRSFDWRSLPETGHLSDDRVHFRYFRK